MSRRRLVGRKRETAPVAEEPLWDLLRDGVTQGFLETLFTCPKKAHLRYREGLEPHRFKSALKFGNVVHGVLDHVYTTFRETRNSTLSIVSYSGALQADEYCTVEQYRQTGGLSVVEQELEEIYASADVLLAAYFRQYPEDFDGSVKWEALEEVFDLPYTIKTGEGPVTIRLRGKVDGRYRSGRANRMWITDHKAKGQIQPDVLLDRLNMDLQVFFYLLATWKLTDEVPAGVLYNVLRRPQLRRKKDEPLAEFMGRVEADINKRPEFYFHRFEVSVNRKDLQEFEEDLHHMLRLAYAWFRQSYAPFRFGPACETKYGACEFLSLCGRGDKFGFNRREHVYPELVPLEVLER